MSRRALPPPVVDRREGVRGALLHTLPGRAIVIGLAVKLAVFLIGLASGGVPPFFGVVDSVAGLAAIAGLAYFTFRLIVLAKRRLLWLYLYTYDRSKESLLALFHSAVFSLNLYQNSSL